jgi:molecular chaperone DnaK
LGVETSGGLFTRLIKRNTTIPTEENKTFATQEDNQTSMMIHVLQGEREMAKDNISVGLFKLDGIPKAPKYEQKVEVAFKIDVNGILAVSAEVLETGKMEVIRVAETKSLSQEEIMRRIIEATKFNEIDEREKEFVETRNRANAAIYAAQKFVEESKRRISEEDTKLFETALHQLKVAMNDRALHKAKESTDKLLELTEGLGAKLKKISQAKMLLSSVERRLGSKLSNEKKKQLEESAKRLEEASHERVAEEISNLREMVTLLEADCGGE